MTGGLFVLLSTSPLPSWIYGILIASVGLMPLPDRRAQLTLSGRGLRRRKCGLVGLGLSGALALGSEIITTSTRIRPPSGDRLHLCVLGDSLSARETDPKLAPWPALLIERGIEVTNLAQMGATERSARRQAALIPPNATLVLLLIGGNDVLGTTAAPQFDEDLRQLLDDAKAPGRAIILLELLLPPFCHAYGISQRRRAREAGSVLLSKRVLARVFARAENTVDGIHLSQSGHRALADEVVEALTLTDAAMGQDAARD